MISVNFLLGVVVVSVLAILTLSAGILALKAEGKIKDKKIELLYKELEKYHPTGLEEFASKFVRDRDSRGIVPKAQWGKSIYPNEFWAQRDQKVSQ